MLVQCYEGQKESEGAAVPEVQMCSKGCRKSPSMHTKVVVLHSNKVNRSNDGNTGNTSMYE